MAGENVPLAIVGIGCLFPKADGPGAFWANIKNGVDCVGPVPPTHWSPADYVHDDPKAPDMTYAARGAFLDPVEFNPLEFGISPVDLEATDTSQLLGLVAARQALNDAGYTPDRPFDKNRISVILGVTGPFEVVMPLAARLAHPRWRTALAPAGVDQDTADRVVQDIGDSYRPWQEDSFPGLLGNVVAGRIANKLDLGGTNCVVDAACASSLSAIHLAGLELAAGRCDVAVTGGVDTFNDIFMYMCFSKTPALSRTGDAKPFDADGDGTILGEGLGIVVLNRLADAERDGARVYAVLKAIGSSSDGKCNAVYAPSAEGQVRALKNAYQLADVCPATIELIEAHGTGTKVGDTVEATALTQVFRQANPDGTWCALGSVKSMIGHTKAAAGAAGLIKSALALYNKVLPPTLKVHRPVEPLEPGKSPLYPNTEKRPWLPRADHPRRAGLSAFGFGGSNFHAVLEEYRPEKPGPDWDGRVQIVALSGDTPKELAEHLAKWPATRAWGELCIWAADSRASFSGAANGRLLLVAQYGSNFGKLVAAAMGRLESEPAAKSWVIPEAAYFGQGAVAGSLGVLFPGQGSQSVGMLRDLACTFPEMLDTLVEAEQGWHGAKRLADFIYPHPAFSPQARGEQEAELRATDVAQPALGAVSLGAWRVLQSFGLIGDVFAGHSYGELVALCAAGAFDATALHFVSRERGRLMASFRGEDAGTMLAVHAPRGDVESILRDEKLNLVIANRNSPSQCVLSGATPEVLRAEAALQRRQLRSTRLPVAAAFHSSLVARASGPFREALEEVSFRRKAAPVFANTNGRKYPTNQYDARDLLAEQLARPVEFVRQIENMALAGVRTFLEVGPGSVLSRLAEATLKAQSDARDWDCFAIDASAGRKPGLLDLAHALARLAARGHAVDVARWEAGQKYVVSVAKPGLTVPIVGANYIRPKTRTDDSRRTAAPAVASTRPASPVSLLPKPPTPEPTASPNAQRKSMTDTPPTNDGLAFTDALGLTQQSLLAFQRMQEETAKLHKQFLDNQHAALTTLQALVAQQQALLGGHPVAPAAFTPPPPAPAYTPPPAPVFTPPPVVPTTVAPPPAPVAKPPAPARDSSAILLSVVADKTGYPSDMLGLDMALDADLGIDSIKRVEILSALQEKLPDAPPVKPEHLGTLHTLRDIINFLGTPAPAEPARETTTQPTDLVAVASDMSQILLSVVSEKTGYPSDMLGLDMALDADLGIDSIKRVEILSALQEKLPDAPPVKPEHLGTLHTLRDIVKFLGGLNGSAAPSPTVPSPAIDSNNGEQGILDSALITDTSAGSAVDVSSESEPTETVAPAATVIRSVIRPVPIDPDSERPRVSFRKGAPVWVIADPSILPAKVSQHLDAAGCRPLVIPWDSSPAAHDPTGLAGLVLLAPDGAGSDDLPLRAFRWLKRAAAPLNESARTGGAFFATITRLDGGFGFGSLDPARDPVQGALAGLSKTASHEWPQVACKAIDVDPSVAGHSAADVVEEILTAGPLEVGLTAKGRFTLELVEAPAVPQTGDAGLKAGDVVVVTGGGRGVTAESLFPLVRAIRPKLVLFGRTAIPESEPEWLAGLTDEAGIRQAIISRLDKPATPREVGEEVRRILARREVRQNLHRLREAGATVEYIAVDVQDAAALVAALAAVRRRLGPVAAVVHGAGVLADRKIEDLTEEQFQSVYRTKVGGLNNVLTATADDPLKAIALFSSSTGRFGRAGQLAYAAANEVLNKSAQRLSRRKPQARVVAVNWGPWAGGMVTPALAKVFEHEGIGLIPDAEGGEVLWRELAAGDRPAEVVVLAQPAREAASPIPEPAPVGPLAPVFEREVSLGDHAVLRSHVLNDKAVVPFVLHLEWMAHAAMHGHPGLKFHGFDELRIFQGVHLDDANPARVRVLSGKASRRDGLFVIPVEIRGMKKGREITQSRAEIVLVNQLPDAVPATAPPAVEAYRLSVDEVYDDVLFHGPDMQALERVEGVSGGGVLATSRTSPPAGEWMEAPVRGAWLADPLALDAAFQLFVLWSHRQHGAASLPSFAGSYRQYRRTFPADGVTIALKVTRDQGSTARADIEFLDADGRLVSRMTDAEHVIDPSLNEAFRRGRATHERRAQASGIG